MRHYHDHYFHVAPELMGRLRSIEHKIDLILTNQEKAMTIAQDLEDEVAAQTTVIGSVEVVVQNLIDEIRVAGTDKTKLEAVLVAAQQNKTRLGALVAAGTPANPEAVASPAVPEITA